MYDIAALIDTMQTAMKELVERVEKGEKLDTEAMGKLHAHQLDLRKLRDIDVRNEVLAGTNLKDVTDKWTVPYSNQEKPNGK